MKYQDRAFLTIKQIAEEACISRMSAVRYSGRPDFPEPYWFGRKKMWANKDVLAWIEGRRRPRGA